MSLEQHLQLEVFLELLQLRLVASLLVSGHSEPWELLLALVALSSVHQQRNLALLRQVLADLHSVKLHNSVEQAPSLALHQPAQVVSHLDKLLQELQLLMILTTSQSI